MHIWIDVENPPQVQYLTPLAGAFREAGHDVVLTARDYGATYELLEARGVEFHRIGASYGKAKWRKAGGLLRRTAALARFFARRPRPDAIVHAGRAPAFAAWLLRVPSFALCDYEYVDVTAIRATRSWVLHPRVFDTEVFVRRGVHVDRLLPFDGIKEDLTFGGVDFAEVEPLELAGARDDLVRVLVRPPAEESHYYRPESGRFSHQLLRHLAGEERAQVLFSPRYASQTAYLRGVPWQNEPVVVPESASFLPLLRSVDALVASGGTMAREAAYLGIPSYSIFQGAIGGVDRFLTSEGRLVLLGSDGDFEQLRIERRPEPRPLDTNPQLALQLVEAVLGRIGDHRRAGAAMLA